MREFVGILVLVNSIVVAIFLLREKSIEWKGFLAISITALVAAVIIAKLPDITQLALSGGKGRGVTVQMERQVQRVESKAQEVEAMAEEIQGIQGQINLLVQNATNTNENIQVTAKEIARLVEQADGIRREVNQSHQTVMGLSNGVRQTMISYVEASFLDLSTRNMIPPPPGVLQEINRHLNILAAIAVPDETQRKQWVAAMQQKVQAIRKPKTP